MSPELIEKDDFFTIEYYHDKKILKLTFHGPFDDEKFQYAVIKSTDLFIANKGIGFIADHRATTAITRKSQKWYVLNSLNMLREQRSKVLDNATLVVVTVKSDPVRAVIVSFIGYLFSLMSSLNFESFDNMEDAFLYFENKKGQ